MSQNKADVVMLRPWKQLTPQRCASLIERMKRAGLRPVRPDLPPSDYCELYVLVRTSQLDLVQKPTPGNGNNVGLQVGGMAQKLTVLIPCKNETHNIRACIESVRQVADEILVADSLSTDDTLEIVRRAGGCRIIEREFVDHADFKNWAIPQASHPWVLVVDADERVTEELAAEIRETLAREDPSLDAYRMRRDNFFLGYPIRHCGWNSATIVRLFRRDVCRYGRRQGPRVLGGRPEAGGNAPRQTRPLYLHVAGPVDGETEPLLDRHGRRQARRRPLDLRAGNLRNPPGAVHPPLHLPGRFSRRHPGADRQPQQRRSTRSSSTRNSGT